MARLKYSDGSTPLLNEHSGYTFQPNAYGESALSSQKNDRFRNVRQSQRQQNLQRCIREWRTMSTTTKNNWASFAAAFPQPCKNPDSGFLTGYQLFLKRNSHCLLNEGLRNNLILEPTMVSLPDPNFSIRITQDSNVIDMTDLYIKNFGLLPEPGQFVICKVLPMAAESGQYFYPLIATLEVLDVYLDGLFASFVFTGDVSGLVFSVYLSKPVWESVQYPGTKYRYMGCFKPTKFEELTDVPAVTPADSGKTWGVDSEGNWELLEAGGGGGNAFNPITVVGQSAVTADQAAEPVEFVAGTNMTITTLNNPKQVIFNSSGGGSGTSPNWGTLRQYAPNSGSRTQYYTLGIPITDSTISIQMRVEFRKLTGELMDFEDIEIFAYVRSGVIGSDIIITRAFSNYNLLWSQSMNIESGFYRFFIFYKAFNLPEPFYLHFSYRQMVSDYTHFWNIPHS